MEAAMGSRLLGSVEETSLQEILDNLRAALGSELSRSSGRGGPKKTHIAELDTAAAHHFRDTQATRIAVSGRSLPLVYQLISTVISPPHRMAVLVVDTDGRFDATCLACAPEHLRHVYVQRPARSRPDTLRAVVSDAESFMLYGDGARASASRQWWGTLVLGGLGAGDVVTGWNGWLRVDREQVPGFAMGMSAEEAFTQRERRQEVVDAAGWEASSPWGGFVFHDD